jgi:hypothetical protein
MFVINHCFAACMIMCGYVAEHVVRRHAGGALQVRPAAAVAILVTACTVWQHA